MCLCVSVYLVPQLQPEPVTPVRVARTVAPPSGEGDGLCGDELLSPSCAVLPYGCSVVVNIPRNQPGLLNDHVIFHH